MKEKLFKVTAALIIPAKDLDEAKMKCNDALMEALHNDEIEPEVSSYDTNTSYEFHKAMPELSREMRFGK